MAIPDSCLTHSSDFNIHLYFIIIDFFFFFYFLPSLFSQIGKQGAAGSLWETEQWQGLKSMPWDFGLSWKL